MSDLFNAIEQTHTIVLVRKKESKYIARLDCQVKLLLPLYFAFFFIFLPLTASFAQEKWKHEGERLTALALLNSYFSIVLNAKVFHSSWFASLDGSFLTVEIAGKSFSLSPVNITGNTKRLAWARTRKRQLFIWLNARTNILLILDESFKVKVNNGLRTIHDQLDVHRGQQ